MERERSLILVVDDETHILHVVSLKLRNAGYDVITAEDGEEALELAKRQQPDLIITDYQMPFMTGVELCEKLLNDPATRGIPAILLTARGFYLPSDRLAQTNIRDVMTKPFSPREIAGRVRWLTEEQAPDPGR